MSEQTDSDVTVINGGWMRQRGWKSREDCARTEVGLTFGKGEFG